MRTAILLALVVLPAARPAAAQRPADPLSDSEQEQVREYADQPVERIRLYLKFIAQRTDKIRQLGADPRAGDRAARLHNLFEEFTRLADELDDNLDTYDGYHSDIRKALKGLSEAAAGWPELLRRLPPDPAYEFARHTALDAAQATLEQVRQLEASQEAYFAAHREERGQLRHEDGARPRP